MRLGLTQHRNAWDMAEFLVEVVEAFPKAMVEPERVKKPVALIRPAEA